MGNTTDLPRQTTKSETLQAKHMRDDIIATLTPRYSEDVHETQAQPPLNERQRQALVRNAYRLSQPPREDRAPGKLYVPMASIIALIIIGTYVNAAILILD